MKKYKILGLCLGILLSGCIIVINQPSAQEKELLTLQDTITKNLETINSKVGAENLSETQKRNLVSQAEQQITATLNEIKRLDLNQKAQDIAAQTVIYLEAAQKLYGQMKNVFDQVNELKAKGEKISGQLKTQLDVMSDSLKEFETKISIIVNNIGNSYEKFSATFKTQK